MKNHQIFHSTCHFKFKELSNINVWDYITYDGKHVVSNMSPCITPGDQQVLPSVLFQTSSVAILVKPTLILLTALDTMSVITVYLTRWHVAIYWLITRPLNDANGRISKAALSR